MLAYDPNTFVKVTLLNSLLFSKLTEIKTVRFNRNTVKTFHHQILPSFMLHDGKVAFTKFFIVFKSNHDKVEVQWLSG